MSKCPVCKSKYLVGGHKIKCMGDRPIGWLNHLEQTLAIAKNRPGRMELLKRYA